MKKSIRENYIFNVTYQILNLITPLITTPYVSRVLEADGIGKYSYITSIVSYFTLVAALGTNIYGQREISYCQNNLYKRSVKFWNTIILRVISTTIVLLLYFAFISQIDSDIVIYRILSANIFLIMFEISWFFQGMEEFKKIAVRDMVFKILGIIFIFLFVKEKEDLYIYIGSIAAIGVMSALSFWKYIPSYVCRINIKDIKPFENIKIVLSLFAPTIATQIYTVLDKTMIGLITTSDFENGYYEQAVKIAKMVLVIVTALGTVMIPRIGYYYAEKRVDKIKESMYQSYRFVFFIAIPLCFGLIGIADNLIPWFLGQGYQKVCILLKIMSILILVIGLSNVTGMQYLIPTQRQNLLTKVLVGGAILNLSLNVWLIPILQSVGAAIASVLAELSIAIIQLICVRKELSWQTIMIPSWKYWISGVIMLLILIIENRYMYPSVLSTIIMILTGGISYFLILILLKDSFFLYNLKNVWCQILNRGDD